MKHFLILCLAATAFQGWGADECKPVYGNAGWNSSYNQGTNNQSNLKIVTKKIPYNFYFERKVRFCKYKETSSSIDLGNINLEAVLNFPSNQLNYVQIANQSLQLITYDYAINKENNKPFSGNASIDDASATITADLEDDDLPIGEFKFSSSSDNGRLALFDFFLVKKSGGVWSATSPPCQEKRDIKLITKFLRRTEGNKSNIFAINNSSVFSPADADIQGTQFNDIGEFKNISLQHPDDNDSKIMATLKLSVKDTKETTHYANIGAWGTPRLLCRYTVYGKVSLGNIGVKKAGKHSFTIGVKTID